MKRPFLQVLASIVAVLVVPAIVGCTAPPPPKTSTTRPSLNGTVSEATETIGPEVPQVVRRFSSADDVDWYEIASPSSAMLSLDTTVLVSMKVATLDSDFNEIAISEYTVSDDGWQAGTEELDARTRYLAVSPLEESQGAYALQVR